MDNLNKHVCRCRGVSFDKIEEAINNGADAVYLAGKMFGARGFANNFTDEELVYVINYAHLYGVKVYVTCNILILEREVTKFLNYVDFLHKNNVDALIMQDLGMIDLVHKTYPNLEIHGSTQMHIHNLDGAMVAKSMGIKRVVLARETPLEVIKEIKETITLQQYLKKMYGNQYMSYHFEDVKNKYGKIVEKHIVQNESSILQINNANMVFVREDGKYVGRNILNYPFKIIHEELGIEKCRFYDLRGSYATINLRNGVEIRDVADILGHKFIETTENFYISSTDENKKNVSDVFDKVMSSDIIEDIIKYEIG